MSKRCQVVKKMSHCQKDVKCQKFKHLDYGGGSQKIKLTQWVSQILTSILTSDMKVIKIAQKYFLWTFWGFLGGLSLHLNHLIAERVSAPYWQFGTLPIGIFLSNLDSRQLKTSLMTSYCHFWHLSTFSDSRAIWVFWPKLGVFRKSKFSRWRSDGASMWLEGFR